MKIAIENLVEQNELLPLANLITTLTDTAAQGGPSGQARYLPETFAGFAQNHSVDVSRIRARSWGVLNGYARNWVEYIDWATLYGRKSGTQIIPTGPDRDTAYLDRKIKQIIVQTALEDITIDETFKMKLDVIRSSGLIHSGEIYLPNGDKLLMAQQVEDGEHGNKKGRVTISSPERDKTVDQEEYYENHRYESKPAPKATVDRVMFEAVLFGTSQNEMELNAATVTLRNDKRVKIGQDDWELEEPYGEKISHQPLPLGKKGHFNSTLADIGYFQPGDKVYRYYLTVRQPTEEFDIINYHTSDRKRVEIIEDYADRGRMRFTRLQFPSIPDKLYLKKRYTNEVVSVDNVLKNYYDIVRTAFTPKETLRKK